MPFTPFYMGIGIFIKGILQGAFSLMVFGIMHSDVQPYYPISLKNELWGFLSINQIHKLCLYSGLLGAGIYYLVQFFNKKDNKVFKNKELL